MKPYLSRLCQRCIDEQVDQWVCILPVLHFFTSSSDFDEGMMVDSHLKSEEIWAGLEGLLFIEFRKKQEESYKKNLSQVAEHQDYIVQFGGLSSDYFNQVMMIEKLLETLLHVLDHNQHRMLQMNSWKSCLHICLKLHQMICLRTKELKYYKLPATNAEIVSRISRLEPLDGSRDETMQKIPVVEVLQRALSATRSWFREVLKQYLLQGHTDSFVTFRFPDELTVWNQFVRISFPDECFTEEWKKTLLSVLEGRIKQERPVRQIAAYCHHHDKFETLDHSVGKSFENCAMEAVNAACQQSEGNLLDLVSSYNLDKFGKLVSAVITKSWPSSKSGEPMDDFDEVLHHLLVWSDIKHIFNFNGADGKILEQLTDAAKKLTAVAGSVFTNVAENLLNGSILVKRLELIIKHQKQFICIWELLDIVEVEEKYHENLDTKELSEVVDVRELNFPMEGTQETYYNLSPELKKVAEMMHRYKDSHIFQLCWERAAQMMVEEYEESEGQIIPILNLHDKLFSPCYHEYKRLYNELKSGKLTFAEVDTIFNDFTSHYEQISTELQIMCKLDPVDNRAWIGQRLQQIQQYHELHLAFDSAKVIAKVKEGLNLSGDFRILQMLLNFTDSFESFKKEKLDSISSALMRAKERLQGITEPRRRCLEELALRKDFINWVKEALEDINELKVFVDLASISAGENDMDVDRVACFHDAVLGYSSLLYELKRESGFEEFMQCVKKLWKALESDENLPKKLCDSARHLEWLKTVKESHGSVELSSLSLATTINSKGIYIIRAPPEGQKVSLDTVLFLSLPESHGDSEEMRQYSLEELRELLNKLMLMSGKGDQGMEVEKFSEVQSGIPEFLFKLLVLQYLTDTDGKMWLRQQCHLYVVEILDVPPAPKKPARFISHGQKYNFLDVFPKITCKSPKEVLDMDVQGGPSEYSTEPGMDQKEFCSEAFQRPFQYLKRFDRGDNLDMFCYEEGSVEGTPAECLQLFLIHCGVIDPTWSELRNFAWFLNVQLRDCEASVFCNPAFVQDTLQGFKNFVVTFMILMARDFATPTLNISDQSPGRQVFDMKGVTEEDLIPFRIRKKWESEPHPYIFFNEDRVSMTFIGFHLQANNNGGIDAINPMSGNIIKKDVMTVQLYKGLVLQRVPFNINFDQLPRDEKLEKLCLVLGIQWAMDPDETYELTTDNILKIFAIEMRFRCGIPVIIMGETGCGKTRLIKFLCELRRSGVDAENMKLVKVHGGTSAEMIHAKIREAEDIAVSNKRQHQFDTILFFDEANTTQAVGSIKEVLCDRTVEGQPLVSGSGLQIIAACNPYRKHAEKMIQRLESAGLGYRVKADKTKDKLGSIPLRQLVYRVHALPPSMIPLVWDFGQLNDITEKIYIQQIVQRLTESIQISAAEIGVVTDVLFASQRYMRGRNDECSFVSLRDVERCVEVFKWFYSHSELLLNNLEQYLAEKGSDKCKLKRNRVIWSLILAVGVCYHASLEKKELYRSVICKYLPKPYDNQKGILEEISLMQDLFLSGVPLRNTIARNLALKENVFMMVICIELKIPLFLVGKPGSSKSLAKTIVADAMQGQAAYSDLYKEMKQIHLVSFQCSPHSTPEGIIGTFKQCARFQDGKNLKEYVSVVVLDEIGLAEDSPKMPLKTLHPLLEDGCIDDVPLPHKKVGFIGISNWALDPAKMNRGIFVSRGDPSNKELIESAKGICSSERIILQRIECYFPIFADAYEKICKTQDREFFGLRDYYSLIKMILALTKASKREPTPCDIAQVVLRNFSGKDDINALDIFTSRIPKEGEIHADDVSTIDLVRQNIRSNSQDGECRYLLVLTENYAALQILQQAFFAERQQPEIIFGSSFPKDQEYTQICRNINRVKICMETGQMVVLLNLQNLYESLYDALNQYYVYLAGQKYVDLGLGTHRVKCRVHPKFRLIVIEEKEVVYKRFPIPLINRLEKHYLDINTVLDKRQRDIVEELMKWVNDFIAFDTEKHLMGRQEYSPSDVFIGYHSDTCASVVLQVTEKLKQRCRPDELMPNVQQEAQLVLLNCATPDSVVRLGSSRLSSCVADHLANKYFKEQQHTSLVDFLQTHIHAESRHRTVFTEITTFSRLLTATDSERLKAEVQGKVQSLSIRSWSLQQFDTEHSFLKEIRNFLDSTSANKILIIQTDFEDGSQSAQLIASAKYSAVNEINKVELGEISVFVYFITKLSRIEGGTSYVGFHGGLWQSVHIDDLRRSKDMVSDVTALRNLTISQLFCEDVDKPEPMIVDGEEQEEEMEVETATSEAEECVVCFPSVPGKTQVLDTTTLLRSCVQSAVGMLRDQSEGSCRSTKRIEILLGFLSKEDDLKASFLKIVKNRLFSLLKKQEENPFNLKDWVLREAANLNALQEAGTFRHTLWKRVQNVVTPFLAHMVSITDRDCNLELLVRPNTEGCVKHLWMFIFSDLNLLSIPYNVGNSSSQTETILVQNDMKVPAQAGNEMPFSWRIKDYLEELWLQAQYIPGTEGHTEKFVGIFQKTPLGEFISSLGEAERNMLFHCYVRDFILLTIGLSSSQELQFLQIALLSCIEELKAASVGGEEKMLSLPWVHLGYHQFRSRLQNFSRILAVNPSVLNSLLYQAEKGSTSSPYEMVLDVFAAMACAEMLEDQVLKSRPQIWLQQVKNLHMPIELVCMESCSKDSGSQCHQLLQEVKLRWNRVFSMSLFVEHMLLGTESLIPELQDLVKRHILLLGNCLQWDSDVKTHKTFTAVMKVLYQCKEEANATICNVAIKRNAQFRQMCNSFFIDLVSTMCFKDNEPPEKAVIQELLRLLFVHREPLRIGPTNHRTVYTKLLSPFNDVVDKTPIIRSVVLKLLLKYSFSDVKAYLQDYLVQVEQCQILDKDDKTELYALFVNCLEDSMYEKIGACTQEDQINCLREDGRFLERYLKRNSQETLRESSIEYLQGVARVRLCLDRVAELLLEMRDQPSQIDRYLVCGKNYRVLRDAVGKAMIECKMKGVAEAQKACNSSGSAQAVHLLLAIFRELTALYGCRNTNLHPKKEQCDAMNTFIQHSKALDSPALKQFAASLVTNSLPSLTVRPQHFSPSGALIEIVVHAAALLLCGQNRVLEPLRSLAFSPATMQCGRPMEHSRCVDCNALIGGSQHIPVHGFQGVQHFTDRTQTGHVLGDPRNREATVASEREMSPVVFIVIRLLTHLAMLLGATKDPQSLRGIIKPPVQDPAGFLQLHIEKDLEQLTKTLGKSADETINVVHLILCSLLKEPHQHPNQWPVRFDGALSTKEHRHEWERIVANTIIIPELKDLDKILTKLNRQISEDERICSNPVAKIVYGDPVTFLSQLPKDNTMHCSRMWSCRKRISVEYLGHVVQQKDGKDVVPILWKFLQKEAELRLVKFLPDILALQRDLVKRFQNITDVEHRTIRDFVSKFHSGEIKLPTGYCDVDLTLDSEFENLLPRRRGPGLCSTALVSYLISLHNDLIYTVEKNTMETNSYSISPSEVADLHVISYEVERDLVPLILSNCQYSVEKGGETLQEFNLEKIQQQVTSRFLQGKPLITLVGIPTLVYRHDRNYEHLFNDVKSKLNQNSLPNSMINMISGELQSYNDICEALSVAEITLGFLAMAGEDPDMLLTHYVEVILQMGDQTSPHVLKALSRCHLKHIIALWQLLSTHKSEQLLRLKRDPFVDVDAAYKAELGSENTTLLNTFLIQAGLETFLQELHEMIILKLKHTKVGDELNPSWREQAQLKANVIEEDTEEWQKDSTFAGLERVGGVDLSYAKGNDTIACASLVVLSYPDLEVLYEDCQMVTVSAPYVAGYLAFREAPFLVEAAQRLQEREPGLRPQVLLVDGNGVLHHRGFGVACHLGVLTGLPCIGVAKNLLQVDGLAKDELHKEQALRSYNKSTKPIYVSVGHRTCLESAVRLVQSRWPAR
ncbi:hypothetical protein UY3_03467 [Chelonia mydas]|uniref:RING-type E3 ubiquitin transferase n=1 Tax=Chelonia mydas TaxID=8469 RepID=M7BPW6_CHEMY|nr:hypothetical protein UY3_03467 [Chelonia mydas]